MAAADRPLPTPRTAPLVRSPMSCAKLISPIMGEGGLAASFQKIQISAALLAVLSLLSACAEDVRLRNPATGEIATCKGGYYSHGLIGMANQTDKDLQMRCLDDFERQGYVRVP